MIDFELSPQIENARQMIHMMAEQTMRPISREYDEREHEEPTEWHEMMWYGVARQRRSTFGGGEVGEEGRRAVGAPSDQRRHASRSCRGATPVST